MWKIPLKKVWHKLVNLTSSYSLLFCHGNKEIMFGYPADTFSQSGLVVLWESYYGLSVICNVSVIHC